MEKDEQIDSLMIDVLNTCTDTQDKLIGAGNEEYLEALLKRLNILVRHYTSEFDISTYEAAGILEALKYDMLADEERVAPDIIGCIDSIKLGILLDTEVAFESDMDLGDDEDEY